VAFFANPIDEARVQVRFYDITDGGKRYIGGDPQYTRERSSRMFTSSIILFKPTFQAGKHYLMTIESPDAVLSSTTFWLLGPN
jgi:hypothetical protein